MEAVTIYIDETVTRGRREKVADIVMACNGVTAVGHYDENPHLMMIEYNPYSVTSHELLRVILGQGLRAEVIGL